MKKLLIAVFAAAIFASCTDAGTLTEVDEGNNPNIEVYKYFYKDGAYVFVAKFKSDPNVVTTTWTEYHGKTSSTYSNIVIYENDSIQIIQKH